MAVRWRFRMGRAKPYAQPGLLICHAPLSRRQRLARMRTAAFATIAVVAVSGIVLQETQRGRSGTEVATAPRPFDYFPG